MTKPSVPIRLIAGCVVCASLAMLPAPQAYRAAAASLEMAQPADLSLGGETVLRLRASAGKLTPQERIDVIEGRLDHILGIPRLTPADVVIYTPAGKPPVIYAVGRKLITVDSATAVAAGGGEPLKLATRWAKRFQQLLPRVDYRKPGDPEPDIPADPPLTITDDPTLVGGQIGEVYLGKKLVIRLRGVQNGITAAERADMVNERFRGLLRAAGGSPDAVTVEDGSPEKDTVAMIPTPVPVPAAPTDTDVTTPATVAPAETPGPAVPDPTATAPARNGASPNATAPAGNGASPDTTPPTPDTAATDSPPRAPAQIVTIIGPTAVLKIGDTALITATTPDATAGGQPNPRALAEAWAKNIRDALAPPPTPATPNTVPATPGQAAPTQPTAPGQTTTPPPPAPGQTAPGTAAPSPSGAAIDGRLRIRSPLTTRRQRQLFV